MSACDDSHLAYDFDRDARERRWEGLDEQHAAKDMDPCARCSYLAGARVAWCPECLVYQQSAEINRLRAEIAENQKEGTSMPKTSIITRAESRWDELDECHFIRLHAKDGSYCTLCSCESEAETEAVLLMLAVLIHGSSLRVEACAALDRMLAPLEIKEPTDAD